MSQSRSLSESGHGETNAEPLNMEDAPLGGLAGIEQSRELDKERIIRKFPHW
jgi:hypothetical protein